MSRRSSSSISPSIVVDRTGRRLGGLRCMTQSLAVHRCLPPTLSRTLRGSSSGSSTIETPAIESNTQGSTVSRRSNPSSGPFRRPLTAGQALEPGAQRSRAAQVTSGAGDKDFELARCWKLTMDSVSSAG